MHGLQWPFHPLQILSWVYGIFQSAVFYFLAYQYFKVDKVRAFPGIYDASLVVYSITFCAVVLSGFLATISDPTDPHIKEYKKDPSII